MSVRLYVTFGGGWWRRREGWTGSRGQWGGGISTHLEAGGGGDGEGGYEGGVQWGGGISQCLGEHTFPEQCRVTLQVVDKFETVFY